MGLVACCLVIVYHGRRAHVYTCRRLALVGVLGADVLRPRRRVVAVRGRACTCVFLALHGAFDVVEDTCGAKWCARVGVVHVEVSSVGLFARSALRVCPESDDDRVFGDGLAGALVYPVFVGDARLNGCGCFLGCVCALLVLPALVESIYVLGGFNPVRDARQVEVSLVVLLGGVVPFLPAQEVFAQERERVLVEAQIAAFVSGEHVEDVALVPLGAGAQSSLVCGNGVVAHRPIVGVACHGVFSFLRDVFSCFCILSRVALPCLHV